MPIFPFQTRRGRLSIAFSALSLALAGCAVQQPYVAPTVNAEGTRLTPAERFHSDRIVEGASWWTALGDPAVDRLVEQALVANPTLDRALAAIAEARAEARLGRAGRLPVVAFEGGANKAWADTSSGSSAGDQSTVSAGLALAWEVDLFGRLGSGATASARRLEARTADAEAVRLSLAADVADTILALRACDHSVAALEAEIASRRNVLILTGQRRAAGLDADIDVALSESGLATAETTLALRRQECAGLTNALVALTGTSPGTVAAVLASTPGQPAAPFTPSALPAGLLIASPGVAAAEREVAAAWADIGAARAARLPRLDLSAALTGQWVRVLGSTSDSAPGLVGAALTLPLFDGGRGAASVSAAEARYAAAVADLDLALRTAARDVENALSAAASAQARQASTQRAVDAADATLRARETQWRAGAVSQFEVEDARRQHAAARDSLIAAARDAAQAWVELVRAAGPDVLRQEAP